MKNPFQNLFKKKDKVEKAVIPGGDKKKKTSFFGKYLKNRLGKSAV